jgi:hypothetical protein
MHYPLGNQRILQLKNVMQTWSFYFEEKGLLPSKDSLDKLKIRAQPTDVIPLRYKSRQHPDDSTDEDEATSAASMNLDDEDSNGSE